MPVCGSECVSHRHGAPETQLLNSPCDYERVRTLRWCSPANHLALSRQGPGFESLTEHFPSGTRKSGCSGIRAGESHARNGVKHRTPGPSRRVRYPRRSTLASDIFRFRAYSTRRIERPSRVNFSPHGASPTRRVFTQSAPHPCHSMTVATPERFILSIRSIIFEYARVITRIVPETDASHRT